MLLRRHFAHHCLASAVVVLVCLPQFALAQIQRRAVVELFTSQGCSSCPPADELLGQFAADPSLLAMSVNIDYWDYIGWKDTLADHRNTVRQRAYAFARGDGKVYTPQVVVNGLLHALGSDRTAIETAIAKSRKIGAMSLSPVTIAVAGDRLNIVVPAGADERAGAEVWLCGLAKAVTVAIGRGENKGREITYHNVLRRWVKLGDWNGKANSWSVPLAALDGNRIDTAAVLVQSGKTDKPKAILGATLAALR